MNSTEPFLLLALPGDTILPSRFSSTRVRNIHQSIIDRGRSRESHPVGHYHSLLIMTGVGIMTTIFSLLMSNGAAPIPMVPLTFNVTEPVPVDQRGLIVLVGGSATTS